MGPLHTLFSGRDSSASWRRCRARLALCAEFLEGRQLLATASLCLHGGVPTQSVPIDVLMPVAYPAKTFTTSSAVPSVMATVKWPGHVFAPYVDIESDSDVDLDLVGLSRASGVRFFTLGFITADKNGNPIWGDPTNTLGSPDFGTKLVKSIAGLRARGGDVAISFGGASGTDLALANSTVSALKNAYQKVITKYSVTHLDFDVEGRAVDDKASIDRRSQAIAALQKSAAASGKPLTVSFTLPVDPTGLESNALYVLKSAQKYGVKFSIVNIMAMDYGDEPAPHPAGKMGTYAIQAANSVFGQLRKLLGPSPANARLWAMIGVTPMIGRNDVKSEVFDLNAARQLTAFAKQKGLGQLSMWALDRDNRATVGTPTNYAFSKVFESFQS